jgi:hypothetical protein
MVKKDSTRERCAARGVSFLESLYCTARNGTLARGDLHIMRSFHVHCVKYQRVISEMVEQQTAVLFITPGIEPGTARRIAPP